MRKAPGTSRGPWSGSFRGPVRCPVPPRCPPWDGADHLRLHVAVDEQSDRGDAHHAVLRRHVGGVVDVELDHLHLFAVLGLDLLELGVYEAARSAPLGPEVDDDRAIRSENRFVEVLLAYRPGCLSRLQPPASDRCLSLERPDRSLYSLLLGASETESADDPAPSPRSSSSRPSSGTTGNSSSSPGSGRRARGPRGRLPTVGAGRRISGATPRHPGALPTSRSRRTRRLALDSAAGWTLGTLA